MTSYKANKMALVRSDGAPSQFKQKYTLEFICRELVQGWFQRVIWSFGCAGHGKGMWDGCVGIVKSTTLRKIRRDT